jgi:hypothetical protein
MKRQFFAHKLDLLNDKTYDMMLRIFRKDDRRAEKQVRRARKSQEEYLERQRRAALAKHNLYPRQDRSRSPIAGAAEGSAKGRSPSPDKGSTSARDAPKEARSKMSLAARAYMGAPGPGTPDFCA